MNVEIKTIVPIYPSHYRGCKMIFDVKLPIEFDDSFIPPELEQVLDFYPEFIEKYGKSIPFQAYMSLIIKEIDRKRPNGFDGQEAFDAFIRHNGGLNWFIDKYSEFAFTHLENTFGKDK